MKRKREHPGLRSFRFMGHILPPQNISSFEVTRLELYSLTKYILENIETDKNLQDTNK